MRGRQSAIDHQGMAIDVACERRLKGKLRRGDILGLGEDFWTAELLAQAAEAHFAAASRGYSAGNRFREFEGNRCNTVRRSRQASRHMSATGGVCAENCLDRGE